MLELAGPVIELTGTRAKLSFSTLPVDASPADAPRHPGVAACRAAPIESDAMTMPWFEIENLNKLYGQFQAFSDLSPPGSSSPARSASVDPYGWSVHPFSVQTSSGCHSTELEQDGVGSAPARS